MGVVDWHIINIALKKINTLRKASTITCQMITKSFHLSVNGVKAENKNDRVNK